MVWTYTPTSASGSYLDAIESTSQPASVSDKTLTVSTTAPEMDNDIPRGVYKIELIHVQYTAGSAVGNRSIRFNVLNSDAGLIYATVLDTGLIADEIGHFEISPQYPMANGVTPAAAVDLGEISAGLTNFGYGCAELYLGPGMGLQVLNTGFATDFTDELVLHVGLARVGRGGTS